jgi:hypothetical protein
MLHLSMNWRGVLWVGFHVFLIASSFLLPQTGEWLLVSWWSEQQDTGPACWRVTRQAASCPRWWSRVQCVYRWGRALTTLSVGLWLLRHYPSHLLAPAWAWLYLVIILPVAIDDGRRVLSGLLYTKASVEAQATSPERHVEVTIDLEPILAEIEDFSPTCEIPTTAREALTARLERIQAECFQHPVGQALMERKERTLTMQIIHISPICQGRGPRRCPHGKLASTLSLTLASRHLSPPRRRGR